MEKKYPNKFHALKNISFGVEKSQIFGFLGPNGAGKSTTFNVMTGLIEQTNGDVFLKKKSLNFFEYDILKNIGICPQFDPLWDHLTSKEHLEIFGSLKGLKGKDLNDSVNYFIKSMQLECYENIQAIKLSGGNKRKLCVANALIGGTGLLFFDEPSTGLDPVAKKFLWICLNNTLSSVNSSIVLTTHSMMEAESLCHKIGIFIY